MTPFRGEKNTNWEGGWRVPAMVRWPEKIKPDTWSNEIMHHMDWLPTLLAAAGVPDIKEQLLTGYSAIGCDYKVHLDGYNFLPAGEIVSEFLATFEDFPPRQKAGRFTLGDAKEKIYSNMQAQ